MSTTADHVDRYADEAVEELRGRIVAVYEEARRDIQARMDADLKRYKEQERGMLRDVRSGKTTKEELDNWRERTMVQYRNDEKRMVAIAQTLVNADQRATEIVNGKTLDVFAEAANFTAFEVSQDFSASFNFILYDSKTVEWLIREQPELMIRRGVPTQYSVRWSKQEGRYIYTKIRSDAEIREARQRAVAWQTKNVANAVTQAIIQGESIPQLSARIARDTCISAGKSTMLYARTAMTSAQNAGRTYRMREVQNMGIKMRKVWLATGDDRVRDAHEDLDGDEVDVDEPFDSMLGPIDYPGDPAADPENVWNCRCSLGYNYPNHPAGDYDNADEEFEDWLEHNEEQPQERPVMEPLSRLDQIRQMVENHTGDWSLDQVQEVGKVFADEVHSRTEGELDMASEYALTRERDKISTDIYRFKSGLARAISSRDAEVYTKMIAEAEEKAKVIRQKAEAIIKQNQSVKDSMQAAFRSVLRELRSVGGVTADNSLDYGNWKAYRTNQKGTRDAMVAAMNQYPTSWLEKSKAFRIALEPHWTNGRAYYWLGEIRFNGRLSTGVHELGHRFEHVFPALKKSEGEFYARRTAGEELKWLGKGYDRSEKTREDKFLDKYMGKDYGGDGYELFSMGAQYACTEYHTLARDPDMESWVCGLFAVIE